MKRKSDNVKSKKIVIISSLMVIIAGILFLSFSYFTPSITEENNYTTSGGANARTPSITYSDLSSGINLTGTYPMTDEEGLTQQSYTFNIRNNESEPVVYDIYLQTETGNTIADNLVSTSLDGSNPKVLNTFKTDNPSNGYSHSYKIKSGDLAANANKDFDLKVWLNEVGTIETVQNKNWYGKIFVKARFGLLGTSTIQNIVDGSPTNSTDVITKTAPEGATCTNTLAYDGTADNNLRYVGVDPCNYATFNDEAAGWRIIGVMNNVDDGTGNQETRIKLVREPLGYYSWDTSSSSENSGYGYNDWTQSDIMNELNGDYLNTSLSANKNWYNGQNNRLEGIYDYTKGLKEKAKLLVGETKWTLGGYNTNIAPASVFYTAEKGTDVYSGRPTQWTGKIALMYPSDFGYAVGGSVRNTCLAKNLNTYDSDSCYSNNWITQSTYQWFLSPRSSSDTLVFGINNNLSGSRPYDNSLIRPTLFLTSEATITGGNGTTNSPYVIG